MSIGCCQGFKILPLSFFLLHRIFFKRLFTFFFFVTTSFPVTHSGQSHCFIGSASLKFIIHLCMVIVFIFLGISPWISRKFWFNMCKIEHTLYWRFLPEPASLLALWLSYLLSTPLRWPVQSHPFVLIFCVSLGPVRHLLSMSTASCLLRHRWLHRPPDWSSSTPSVIFHSRTRANFPHSNLHPHLSCLKHNSFFFFSQTTNVPGVLCLSFFPHPCFF